MGPEMKRGLWRSSRRAQPEAGKKPGPLLRDEHLQAGFNRDGFAVVPLLTAEQVNRLLALYRRHVRQDRVTGLYESSRHNPYDVNRLVNETIREEVILAGRDLFLPSKIYGGSFMVKAVRDSEILPLHQDWSVVDEHVYSTIFIWCPLSDVSARNGCLFVLPGSHLYFQSLRSGTYPSDRFFLSPDLQKYVLDVPLKAGEAVLYSDRLFHGSYANTGHSDRVVVTSRAVELSADLLYFQKASDRQVDVFHADEQLYLTHIDALAKGQLPPGMSKSSRRAYVHQSVTADRLAAKVRQHHRTEGDVRSMKQLFIDGSKQSEFEKNGYAVIDLLDQTQVCALKAFYESLVHDGVSASGFQVSLDNESADFVRTISERLVSTVQGQLDRQFKDYKLFTASFVTKAEHPMGVVPPHQDWTFVDETEFWSATIWCPLVNVSFRNGTLGLIKGSHRFYQHVRPSPSPQYAPPFTHQLADICPYLDLQELRAGQAVVFHNQTLHASPPNSTSETRVAFGVGITHRDAALRHYYLLPNQSEPLVEGYEVEPEFFYHYNNAKLRKLHEAGQTPAGLKSVGVFRLEHRRYDTRELREHIRAGGNEENRALGVAMAALFAGPVDAPGSPAGAGAARTKVRPLWKVYTPINIAREIRYRLTRPQRHG